MKTPGETMTLDGICEAGPTNRRAAPALGTALVAALCLLGACAAPPDPREGPKGESTQRIAAYHYSLAQKFWEQDRSDLALRNLEMAVREDPEAPEPRLKILDIYLFEQDSECALEYLGSCPESLQEQPPFLHRRALALEIMGEEESAAEILSRESTAGSEDPLLLRSAAENRLVQDDMEGAMEILKEARRSYPEEAAFPATLAELCRVTERYAEEAKYLIQLAHWPDSGLQHIRAAARAFAEADLIDEGLDQLARLPVGGSPTRQGVIKASLGYLAYRKGDYDAAEGHLTSAMACSGFLPDRDEVLALAEIRMRKGDFHRAAEVLKDHLDLAPEDPVTRAALAWAYFRDGYQDRGRQVIADASGLQDHRGILKAVKERLDRAAYED